MFNQAHDFNVAGTFIEGNVNHNYFSSNQFMEKLLKETIPGAAFDSSARHPAPRCYPGTRLAILERCLYFIASCSGVTKVLWVVGATGVGKSAIIQSVVESPKLSVGFHASVFFSINGRDDGTKTIITLSYQFAAKSELYRQVIEYDIARDPSLLDSSLPVQFKKLIVEPFVHHPQLNSMGRVLIAIDALDECNDSQTQRELLHLICDFCAKYPSSPLIWLIACRPEQHITSFFARPEVMLAYEKEEIPADSNEARADVERFLRHELMEIKQSSDSLRPLSEWPEERAVRKLVHASGGLFAYAHTVLRYIGDQSIGNPASQLRDVLHVLDNHPMTDVSRGKHPMALLDVLYARVLSNVPAKVMLHTRKLLLALASGWRSDMGYRREGSFVLLCNWLGMTCDEGYAAVKHLHSVLRVPKRDDANREEVQPFHKSFIDYVSDFSRSGFSRDIKHEAQQLKTQCAFRVLREAPDGIDFGNIGASYKMTHGTMKRGPGTGGKISLTWPVDSEPSRGDNERRLRVYKVAVGEIIEGVRRGDPTFQSVFCIQLLATQFEKYTHGRFPYFEIRDLLLSDGFRRHELTMHGILKQMPLTAADVPSIFSLVRLDFRRPATTVTNLPDPWNSSCDHPRVCGKKRGKKMAWHTNFWGTTDTFGNDSCAFCLRRLENQLERWNAQAPDRTAATLFTSVGPCCVEFRFVDPEDGMAEWAYAFWTKLPSKQCLKV